MDGRIPTGGGDGLGQNPFGSLQASGLPPGPGLQPKAQAPVRNRGRVDIKRETGGRGGKTVTVVSGFIGIGAAEKESLMRKMRGACGCGGTLKDGCIEIQGDQRDTVALILSEAGFRPVFAGG